MIRDTVFIECNPDTGIVFIFSLIITISIILGNATVGKARLYDVRNKRESTEGILQIGDAGKIGRQSVITVGLAIMQ